MVSDIWILLGKQHCRYWRQIFCCTSMCFVHKEKSLLVNWHNDFISNDASLLHMVQVRLFHLKTYISEVKKVQIKQPRVRTTLEFTYDEWLENNHCNVIMRKSGQRVLVERVTNVKTMIENEPKVFFIPIKFTFYKRKMETFGLTLLATLINAIW